jgi:hypothetical protein
MPDLIPDVVPVLILMAGFAAGFYMRHRVSVKRQKHAKHSFFKQI